MSFKLNSSVWVICRDDVLTDSCWFDGKTWGTRQQAKKYRSQGAATSACRKENRKNSRFLLTIIREAITPKPASDRG